MGWVKPIAGTAVTRPDGVDDRPSHTFPQRQTRRLDTMTETDETPIDLTPWLSGGPAVDRCDGFQYAYRHDIILKDGWQLLDTAQAAVVRKTINQAENLLKHRDSDADGALAVAVRAAARTSQTAASSRTKRVALRGRRWWPRDLPVYQEGKTNGMKCRNLMTVVGMLFGLGWLAVSPADAKSAPAGHGAATAKAVNTVCLQNCRLTSRLCGDGARTEFQTCKLSMCGAELQAAKKGSATEPGSAACRAARADLDECTQPCRRKFADAVRTCQVNGRSCAVTCAGTTTVPDAQCVGACRATSQTCWLTAIAAAHTCTGDCATAISEAEIACAVDPRSSTCSVALEAALACVEPCKHAERDALQTCTLDSQSCLTQCQSVGFRMD